MRGKFHTVKLPSSMTMPPAQPKTGNWFAVHRHGPHLCISVVSYATREACHEAKSKDPTFLGAVDRTWFHREAD